MARSSSSSLWRSLLGRLHSQQNVHPSTSSSSSTYGALLHGFRFMSTGATSKLFVGGLSWSTDENALKEAFSSYGDISEAKVVLDRETGRSRGFGFVSFLSIEDAESAKEGMDGNDINGRTVRVDFATEKPPSARPFGGYGGGGGGSFGGGSMGFGGESVDSSFGDSYSRTNTSFSSQGSFASNSFGKDSFENKSSDEGSFGNDLFDDHSGSKDRY